MIEEQARGDKAKADALRGDITGLIGTDLSKLVPGSEPAMKVKQALIARGVWSQYLEVGIGPDPEIFTKCQPMASVGQGADEEPPPVVVWRALRATPRAARTAAPGSSRASVHAARRPSRAA